MVVCQYFLRGQCKFGDSCRNEHPANARQGGFGASSWNRAGNDDQKLTLPFSATSISNDLTPHIDKPMWPLSSYAPSKHEPLLITGLDESPEELRVKAAAAVASGNINGYLEYEGRQIAAADQVFANARSHSTQAYDQAVKQSEIPARLAAASNTQTTTSSVFGNNNTNSTSSAFSSTNPTTSTFGQPAFGQPAFGQSAFGQPGFGQPVQNPSTSATSTPPAPTGAFGQPLNNPAPVSAFGQPPPPPATSSVFGQPSALGTSSFIKPASGAFGSFNNTESAFGNKSTPAANTGVSGGGGFSAFATQPSAFSLAAKTNPTGGSTFGQPSFGQPAPAISIVPASTSVFGNPNPAPAAPTSVFGTPSAFGVLSQPQQQPSQQPSQQQGQQQTAPVWPSSNNNNSFGTNPNTTPSQFNSTFGNTAPMTQSTSPPKSSRTKSVYKPGSTPYDQQIPSNYKESLPKSAVQAFESQNFEWGKVPEWVPPVDTR